MEANELRIGNWILIPYQNAPIAIPAHETKVQGITIFGEILTNNTPEHEGLKTHINHISGIPLTEEWLLKFGFQMLDHSGTHFLSKDIEINNGNHPDLYLHFHIKNGEIVNSGITLGEIDNEDGYEGERTHLVNIIEYVHQLQNLYFALTGKELTI